MFLKYQPRATHGSLAKDLKMRSGAPFPHRLKFRAIRQLEPRHLAIPVFRLDSSISLGVILEFRLGSGISLGRFLCLDSIPVFLWGNSGV